MTARNTIADCLQSAVRALSGHSESPRLDAELLLGKILGLSRSGLMVHTTENMTADSRLEFEDLIGRRSRGTPVAYLTGTREFWSLALTVTPDVLVPRPETEMLVERALELLPEGQSRAVLDLGTGSGAIALAIAAERPRARVVGADLCEKALRIATANAHDLGLAHVEWCLGSWFQAVPDRRFDLIAANPPYVASGDPALANLAAEPRLALTPGATGLEALTAILAGAAAHLNSHGWLLLEHGAGQADEVARLFERRGFTSIRSHADYSGRPRITLGTLHQSH
jgi:release factor glutamine methyltransferase